MSGPRIALLNKLAVHVRFGKIEMRDSNGRLRQQWPDSVTLAHNHPLVTPYCKRLEGID
jgi:hypothetical protein